MKLHSAACGLLSLVLCSQALATSPESEKIVEQLLTSRTPAEFSAAYKKAQLAKLPAQTLLEARFLYLVDQEDNKALAALSSELVAATPSFTPEHSSIFSLKEDWLAIVHYTQALDALEKKQPKDFKKHITEAFWLSPRQAAAFAPHIDQLRLDQAMQKLTIPLTTTLPNLKDKHSSPLFTKDTKATLLYFWSPWSREFGEGLEDFKSLATEVKRHNIHLVAILAEKSESVATDARKFISEEKLQDSATWSTDTADLILSRALRVQSVPTSILISTDGKVLSNSHPASPKLWNALKNVAPKLKRPIVAQPE